MSLTYLKNSSKPCMNQHVILDTMNPSDNRPRSAHLIETYDVKYFLPSCRRLLNGAGLCYKKLWPERAKADPKDCDRFGEESKKKAAGDGHHSSRPGNPVTPSRHTPGSRRMCIQPSNCRASAIGPVCSVPSPSTPSISSRSSPGT